MGNRGQLKIFSGNAGKHLATNICVELSRETGQAVSLGEVDIKYNDDGEVRIRIREDIRGADVFIINPTNAPKENAWEMRVLAETAKDSSAERVTIVPLYLGDNRADYKYASRVAVSPAKIMIDFLKSFTSGGVDRVLLLDLHSEPTMAFFKPELIPDHLYASSIAVPYMRERFRNPFVVASPGKEGFARALAYAQRLGQSDCVVFYENKSGSGSISGPRGITIAGDVKDKDVIFVGGILDTGITIRNNAWAAKQAGAKCVFAFATHALLSRDALEVIASSEFIDEIIFTDTIRHENIASRMWKMEVTVLSVAPLFARAINLIHNDSSLSPLFAW